ncbi:MAG: hypothetical protein ACRENL_01750 [Candidatus Dormibacteria bacterium]
MSTAAYIAVAIVVLLLVAVALIVALRRRSQVLHRTFGSEYDRAVRATGNRRQAERELSSRVRRRKQLCIMPLPESARRQYLQHWQQVQADFIDAPSESVRRADVLVSQVMTDRGYPMAEFEQRTADLSVDHADAVEGYRSARAVCLASGHGGASTEDLRRAMTQYRALFHRLLGSSEALPEDRGASRLQVPHRAAAQPVDAGPDRDAPPPPPSTLQTAPAGAMPGEGALPN